MNLKLAEYNIDTANTISLKPPKFQGFLELGKDFSYSGDFITLSSGRRIHKDPIMPENVGDLQKLFNGLFVGRTYSRRFVLIIDSQDEIFERSSEAGVYGEKELGYKPDNQFFRFRHEGNLHENPELYEKLICKNA